MPLPGWSAKRAGDKLLTEVLLKDVPGWLESRTADVERDPVEYARFVASRQVFRVTRKWGARLSERLRATGQPTARWLTLFWISVSGEAATQRELATRVGINDSTLVRALDVLEKQGLIERRAVEGDRRANTIRLTEAAKPVVDEIEGLARIVRDEVLSSVEPGELAVFLSVLNKINTRLDRLDESASVFD